MTDTNGLRERIAEVLTAAEGRYETTDTDMLADTLLAVFARHTAGLHARAERAEAEVERVKRISRAVSAETRTAREQAEADRARLAAETQELRGRVEWLTEQLAHARQQTTATTAAALEATANHDRRRAEAEADRERLKVRVDKYRASRKRWMNSAEADRRDSVAAHAAVDRARELHRPVDSGAPCIPDHSAPTWCPGCSEVCAHCRDEEGDRVQSPCATIAALDGTEETP